MLARRPTARVQAGGSGRYVIYQKDDNGYLYSGWLSESESQQVLAEAARDPRRKYLQLTVEVTNPKAVLLPREPLCVLVKTVTTEAAVPDFAEFTFEVIGPGAAVDVEVMDVNLLEKGTGRPYFEFKDNPQNDLVCNFHAVLVLSNLNSEETAPVSLLTERVGEYQIKVKERRTGCESAPIRFNVVAGTAEDREAASLFGSEASRAVVSGDISNLAPFEKLLKKHPNTRYASYAALWLGRAKLEQLEASGKGKRNDAKIAALEPYADQALRLGFPSAFELNCTF